MKKIKNFGLLCIAIPLLSSCQIYGIVKDATDHEEGRIIMKNGTEYVGRVKMPKCNTENIHIKTENGEKIKLKNTDMQYLGYGKRHILINAIISYVFHIRQTKCSLQKKRKR